MKFSETLNDLLSRLSCTAKELCAASGLSEATLSRYRSGERLPQPGFVAAPKAVLAVLEGELPPSAATDRVATRGAEWFTGQDGLIREIRSYYSMRPGTTELDGFPYAERGYSVPGAERSAIHAAS